MQQPQTVSRLVDVATRLREVRDAKRYFLDMWRFELDELADDRNASHQRHQAIALFDEDELQG